MNIGFVTGEFPPMPGGVGDFTRNLAERIQERGHEVHILSRNGSTSASLAVSTVRGWGAGSLPAIRTWARRQCLDIVNLQFQTAAFDMSPFIHFLRAALDAPLVTTFHDLRFPYLFPKAGPLRDWIVMRLARSSDGIITTDHEDHIRLARFPNRRLIPIGSSIPNANCDDSRAATGRWRAYPADDAFVLGHFGFLNAAKGIDYLIEALASLRAAGHNLRLLFIGAKRNAVDTKDDAAYAIRLEDRIRQLSLEDAIDWTGYLPDLEASACFHAVDLMALPFVDGASYRRSSLIAAIHCGCAILTTEPAAPVKAFEHGKNLWLVPPASSAAIEGAIQQLMNDREQVKQLQTGAARLRRHFAWEEIARETIAMYQSII